MYHKSRYPDSICTLAVLFEIFKVFWLLAVPECFNRGTLSGTQTGSFNMYIINLIQRQEKLTEIPPVSAVIPMEGNTFSNNIEILEAIFEQH